MVLTTKVVLNFQTERISSLKSKSRPMELKRLLESRKLQAKFSAQQNAVLVPLTQVKLSESVSEWEISLTGIHSWKSITGSSLFSRSSLA